MALSTGDKLGPYDLVAPLGAGGMGEVYKARDTRLDRFVAIKVLPDHIAHREDARARFEREARTVASLNHPNICVLFDIGPNYMVMELIEGETLAAHIQKGALALDQALTCATQIADALDRAHRAGVTHRDIKPGNIMLTRDGIKVLDFGLAKSTAKPGPTDETLTNVLTTAGTVLGTPQYMAPEQFEGKEADARSDIWAFGAVLYEMVTGRKAFEGRNYTSLVAAILGADPPPMAVKPFTPRWLERLVRRCLQKDPEDRYLAIHDIVLDLKSPPVEAASAPAKLSRLPWAVAAGAVLLTLVATGMLLTRKNAAAELPVEFEIPTDSRAVALSISPDGKMIVWRNQSESTFSIRSLDSAKVRTLPMEGQSFAWSPDGKSIAFRQGQVLKRLDLAGSAAQTVSSGFAQGIAWTQDGYLIFGSYRGPLRKVRASGGDAVPLWELDQKAKEIGQLGPTVLPDGQQVIYFSIRSDASASGAYLARLDGTSPPRRIHAGAAPSKYIEPNSLLINRNERLGVVHFDSEWEKPSEPVMLTDPLDVGSFDASRDGRVIAYAARRRVTDEIALYDRSGKKLETIPGAIPGSTHLEMSRDGKRLLLERSVGNEPPDIWTIELGRNVVSRLTFHEGADGPGVFSADGTKVFFYSVRNDGEAIFEIPSNGAGSEKLIIKAVTHHMHASPDGKYLMIERMGQTGTNGLDVVELATRKRTPYLDRDLHSPQFSPDSRLVAYESEETGRREVYVATFPAGGGRWQISTGGGIEPRWRADGKELYFLREDGTVMAAGIEARTGSLTVRDTRELFRFRLRGFQGMALTVSPDGKLFAVRERTEGRDFARDSAITVKMNWKLSGK